MKTAVYTNHATNEVYKIGGVTGIDQAWNLVDFACRRNNWNPAAFNLDVTVKIEK